MAKAGMKRPDEPIAHNDRDKQHHQQPDPKNTPQKQGGKKSGKKK